MLSPGSRLGKYRIERPLGRGGMGAVFLATDTVLRRPVAIKVLVSEADDTDRSPARLLHEARSASALNHPNIVAVYEIAEENDCAFISMEYVHGQPLSDLVEAGPLTVEQSIRYAIEAADALAHAHERGIVHSDLKAANAIVSSSGRIKLVDFGIASRLPKAISDATVTSTATSEKTPAGTPYAMAPEQVRGAHVDVRTDVWALGVMLYEMLAGVRPFVAPTVPELFSAILRDAPAPLPDHVPSALRVIVQKCLDKEPVQRYERASDVRVALEVVASGDDISAGHASRPVSLSGAPLPPSPLVSTLPDATAFVGRDSEIGQMTRAWDRARAGGRCLLLLAGEPGIGKTRLAMEFARHCAAQHATVLAGRSDEEALVPYQPFAEALTWFARVCPERELRAILNGIDDRAELGRIVLELTRRIPELRTVLKSGAEGERHRLFDAIDALFAAASSVHPIVLVLDDVHWADQPTLLLLKHLMRSTRTAALCIVATYRDSELRRTHPLAEILADLRRDESVARLSLRGLTATDVQGLAPSIAGQAVPPQLAEIVVEGAGGNPFFIGEVLRHWRETDAFAHATDHISLGLPEGVKEVIGRRLSRLSDECNRALALAAVIGREFDVELLIALGDLPEDRLLDAIDEAVRAQLIAEAAGGRGRLTFRHALIRETLYGELLSARRIRLHRRVAEAIEEGTRGRANPPLADLAYHFSQSASAGTANKAVEYAMRAGDRAAELLAYEEAARMYDLALQSVEFADAPDLVARRVDLHIRRARAFGSLGQWAAEKEDALRALEWLDPDDLERRAELVLMVADASFYLLDNASVNRYAAEALDLSRKVNRNDLAADAMGWLGRSLQAKGELAAAIDMDNQAFALGTPRRGIALMHGPLTLYLAGQLLEAARQGKRAADAARTGRDTELTMYALSHYGLSLGAIGKYRDAARTFAEAREFGRKYGVLPPLARAISMSGGFHVSVFDLDGAEAIHTEARELARSLNFMPTIVSSGIDLLFVHLRRMDLARAQALLPEVEGQVAGTPGWHEWLWQGRLKQVRAELALAGGDARAAFEHAQGAIEYWRGNGRIKYEALGLVTAARALRALDRTREAIAHARDALAVARRSADPALVLWTLNALLALDGDDALAGEARTVSAAIKLELPDESMQRRFDESELVQAIPHS
jgi:tetratricopeptide (TPR) repeat protein/predicted Ser/Thr protein kinase